MLVYPTYLHLSIHIWRKNVKNNKENLYSVLVNDTYLDLSSDFVKTILITYDNGLTFEYLVPYNNHYLALENKNKCVIYIIGSDGFTYVCNCDELSY